MRLARTRGNGGRGERGEEGRERAHTDLDANERDDDLLEALRVAGGDGLLEELEHVLQDLDARVEQVDALRDLEVPARGVVERLQVRVRLQLRCAPKLISKACIYARGGACVPRRPPEKQREQW